jgi:ribosomal protein S18 acetylase RimI-like enzyme
MHRIDFHHAEAPPEIAACFAVMRELRPHLQNEAEFVERVQRQFAEGYRLLSARAKDRAIGLAGYRPQENLIHGRFIYVDDLVVAATARRVGVGALLLDAVAQECRRLAIATLVLDTAIDNSLAQRFYFRYGMLARGLRFSIPVQR